MTLTTTPTVEGRTVTAYHGIVFGEVIAGVNMFRDIAAGFRNRVRDAGVAGSNPVNPTIDCCRSEGTPSDLILFLPAYGVQAATFREAVCRTPAV